MTTISTYIWGIRYGFEANHALFPEKVRLDDPEKINEYDEIVQNFTEQKDSWFRICNRDFYFMLQNNKYRLYSLVVSNHNDIAGRKSFLVFSLVCPTGKILQGDVVGVLNQLKALYKEKNADETINRNLFTADHVNRLVQVLNVVLQTSGQTSSNAIFTINSEDQIPKIFREYVGNEVYFITEGTNAEMIASMPTHFKKRKFGDPINPGGQGTGGTGTGGTVTGGTETGGTGLGGTGTGGTGTGGTGTGIGTGGTGTGGTGTRGIVTFEDRLNKIYTACEAARKNNWKDDITEIEKLISSEPALENRLKELHEPDYKNLQNWRAFQAVSIGKLVEDEFNALYKEIYDSSKSDRKNKLDEFNNKVKNLKLKVDALTHNLTRQKITSEQRYHDFVIAKTWVPKNRKPLIIKLSIVGLVLVLAFFGILSYLNKKSEEKIIATTDTDLDGIFDDKDKEKTTQWLKDTSNYKLKDYVNSEGEIDTNKTKNLCNCWKFPANKDRDVLKCKENLNWFVYKDKLYEFRTTDAETARFYSSAEKIIATNSDNDIEQYHEKQFPNNYTHSEEEEVITPPVSPQEEYETISYNNKKYKLKKGVVTTKGIELNNANYRYLKSKWETQINPPNGTWGDAKPKDVNFLLNKKAIEIKESVKADQKKENNIKDEKKTTETIVVDKNTPTEAKATTQNNEADDYWIKLDKLASADLGVSYLDYSKVPISKEGKTAKTAVKNKYKAYKRAHP